MGIEGPFWRAIAVYRVASLVYAAVLLAQNRGYEHPAAGWTVIGVMTLWTAGTAWAYAVPALRRWPLLGLDLLITLGCLLASPYVEGARQSEPGTLPVPATWIAGPVLAWAVHGGRRAGAVAAAAVAGGDLWLRLRAPGVPLQVNGAVLLFLAGVVVGHVARLARQAEERMQRAVEMEAAQRERERLARDIHDSVLQVLALVQRRGQRLGGEAAELGRLAGEQEAALRQLVAGPAAGGHPSGLTDLRSPLLRLAGPGVTVSTPATPVLLTAEAAREVTAAVKAALDNVRAHCGEGARAWVLAEEGEEEGKSVVTVSVRDDGPGMPAGRLAEARAEGRLGVAESIRGRIARLGGHATVTAVPGQGTEIELTLPTRP
ncbi:DUF5931 domain-containing protein [Actinomadura sp. ATCC 31491]|uniref:DUF5931 domain-containing protein n=1 Tax=Actinomadura luzonensis TaxID=2805427 RepID=A0ABT0G849_9ACTN|nr:DUF5931 domain-containing protein [Actinomadura luzonensis]MCK2220747.1 DUF5931 domain-containing protein [Actinomadura luzonensis]